MSVLHTKLCDLLEIEYPIMLAGMGGFRPDAFASPHLAAMVSNAGGFGVLGCSGRSPDEIRTMFRQIREETDKPFGADITVPRTASDQALTPEQMWAEIPQSHKDWYEYIRQKHNLPKPAYCPVPFTAALHKSQVETIIEEHPHALIIGLGNPAPFVEVCHSHGILVAGMAGASRHARRIAESGADFIVAQGHEAGGHNPRVGGMALLPQAVDAAKRVNPDVPVVYAGAVADGRQFAAALMLGAAGVWCGSLFLTSTDADTIHNEYKRRLLSADDDGTVVDSIADGMPSRVLKPATLTQEHQTTLPGVLPMTQQRWLVMNIVRAAEEVENWDMALLTGGQGLGLVKKSMSAKELVDRLVEQTVQTLKEVPKTFTWGD